MFLGRFIKNESPLIPLVFVKISEKEKGTTRLKWFLNQEEIQKKFGDALVAYVKILRIDQSQST